MNNGPLYVLVIFQHTYLPGVKVPFDEHGSLKEDVLTGKYSFDKATINNPLQFVVLQIAEGSEDYFNEIQQHAHEVEDAGDDEVNEEFDIDPETHVMRRYCEWKFL
jgi:hypothetical protein